VSHLQFFLKWPGGCWQFVPWVPGMLRRSRARKEGEELIEDGLPEGTLATCSADNTVGFLILDVGGSGGFILLI
jgi:hypothetical protein